MIRQEQEVVHVFLHRGTFPHPKYMPNDIKTNEIYRPKKNYKINIKTSRKPIYSYTKAPLKLTLLISLTSHTYKLWSLYTHVNFPFASSYANAIASGYLASGGWDKRWLEKKIHQLKFFNRKRY